MAREDHHFRLRIPGALKAQVAADAAQHHRSITAEIVARLEAAPASIADDLPTADHLKKAAMFWDTITKARDAGKNWWVDAQIAQIEDSIAQDRKIAGLLAALRELVEAYDNKALDGEYGPIFLAALERQSEAVRAAQTAIAEAEVA